jgi:adenosine deaminase
LELIERMPKVDLHIHLDGSVRPQTVREIALEEDVQLPTTELSVLLHLLQVDKGCKNLPDYLSKFELPLRVMQSESSLRKIAFEIVEDAALQGVRYIEVRFAPQLHTQKGLSIEEVIAAVVSGLEAGERKFSTIARAIVICMRNHLPGTNLKVMQSAQTFLGKGVVGLDLAGDEAHYPPIIHKDVFRLAYDAKFPITIHAGEAAGPENIRESVMNMFAQRIGHGVRLKEDPRLLEWIIRKQIPLEMCITSNVQTRVIPDWKSHPIKEYFSEGVLVTINTDNTTVSNTNITKEIRSAVEILGLSIQDIASMTLTAVKVSFLEGSRKNTLVKEYRTAFQHLGIIV